MTQSDPRQTLLAVNSTEWLNLCARGSIRISKRRPAIVSVQADPREMEKVFASAPFTKLESSLDLFVLVINEEWTKSKVKHRAFTSEILILQLSDVIAHHPVALEHLDHYRNIGSKCGIDLKDAIFERSWLYWITNERINASCDAAERLQSALQILPSSKTKRADKYKWGEIARLVLRPNDKVKTKSAHVETLLSNIRDISDAVASTRDSEQFYIACAIEWIDTRLKKDPMKKKATKEILLAALANAKDQPLSAPGDQTSSALKYLMDHFPKAFTDELTPLTIAHLVQLLTDSRTKKLKIINFFKIIYTLDRESPSATLITFTLATSLGIELTNQLILGSTTDNLVEINWESPN